MSQTITVQFIPLKQDYAAALRLFLWQRRNTKISLAILVVAFGAMLSLLLSKGSPPTVFEVIWLLMPPFFVIFIFLVQPGRMARRAAATEQLVSETTWEVSEAGVQIATRFGTSQLEWDTLDKLVKGREYYLLLSKSNRNAFRFIPHRAFSSIEQQHAFEQLVETHLNRA